MRNSSTGAAEHDHMDAGKGQAARISRAIFFGFLNRFSSNPLKDLRIDAAQIGPLRAQDAGYSLSKAT